jgi:hypothetical protein
MSVAAAVVDRLYRAGLRDAALPGWWRTPRRELAGRTPRHAIQEDGDAVLELAERDARFLAEHGDLPLDEGDPRRPAVTIVRGPTELRVRGDYVSRLATSSRRLLRTWTLRVVSDRDGHPAVVESSLASLLTAAAALGWQLDEDELDELVAQLQTGAGDLRDAVVEAALKPRSIEHVSACTTWSTSMAIEQVGALGGDAGHLVDLCDAHNAFCADVQQLLEAIAGAPLEAPA